MGVGKETGLGKQSSYDQPLNSSKRHYPSFVLMNYRCKISTANNRRIF